METKNSIKNKTINQVKLKEVKTPSPLSLDRTCVYGLNRQESNFLPFFSAQANLFLIAICFANKVFHYFSSIKSPAQLWDAFLKNLVCPDVSLRKWLFCTARRFVRLTRGLGKEAPKVCTTFSEFGRWGAGLPCRNDSTHAFQLWGHPPRCGGKRIVL